MIDTKFYMLKNGKKEEFLDKIFKEYDDQRENIVRFNSVRPNLYLYHIKEATVFVNTYNKLKNPLFITITTWGKTREDLEKKVRAAKTLLEEVGEEELIESNLLSGE